MLSTYMSYLTHMRSIFEFRGTGRLLFTLIALVKADADLFFPRSLAHRFSFLALIPELWFPKRSVLLALEIESATGRRSAMRRRFLLELFEFRKTIKTNEEMNKKISAFQFLFLLLLHDVNAGCPLT